MSSTQAVPKPKWLKVRAPGGENYTRLKQLFRSLNLHTVCEEASCPNVGECWGGGTATVMLLGDTCTRGCRFCHVKTGKPNGVVDELEPVKVGSAIGSMDLTYIVLTSVDRDDLPDGGADHFGRTVEEIKKRSPQTLVEVLTPDFRGDLKAMERIVASGADVIAHNLETVERLQKRVRDPRCGYRQSLDVLAHVKKVKPAAYTKSSLMVGLGETREEMSQAMDDLRAAGVDILTIGQYLRPSEKHLPVEEFLHPTVFTAYEEMGLAKGFKFVPSGPLVRSSYKAGEKFLESLIRESGKA
jgi:lipoyl synthase